MIYFYLLINNPMGSSPEINDENNLINPKKEDNIEVCNVRKVWVIIAWAIFLGLYAHKKIDLTKIQELYYQATEFVQVIIDRVWDAIYRSLQP